MGIEEGTCWDEHWVLYGNQCNHKFYEEEEEKEEVVQGSNPEQKTYE